MESGDKQRKFERVAKYVARFIWCVGGGAIAIGFALLFMRTPLSPFVLASLSASTIYLFGLTRDPAAQPRALFGGHFWGALIGILCYQAFGDALWVYVLALVLTLTLMLATRTVHPPAGANPLIMVHEHANLLALWNPVGIGVLILFLVAVVWSRLLPRMARYPVAWFDKSPPHFSGWEE